MALTRQFKETVAARVGRDPAFREALLREGIETLLAGDIETGKAILRDYINATVGFESLAAATGISAKSLMRMFGPNGNPQAQNLFAVLSYLQKEAHLRMEVSQGRAQSAPRRQSAGGAEMSKRDIGKEILAGLGEIAAWKRGEIKLKTTRVELPRTPDVRAMRARLGPSQEAFATRMGVSVGTLRNWEQGRREPQGPARALLLIADRKPRAFLEAAQLVRRERRAA